jgi:mannan endo-1,6-alpha-mannosidase
LTNPPAGNPTWIDLVKVVLDDQISRWDAATCGGGLRWQIFSFNNGYTYKNSASNGGFFQLAARYARYTNNQTYAAWAEEVYDWTISISLIDNQWNVYDGTEVFTNCTSITKLQFSYLAGTYITGAAHMYNMTNGDPKWKSALDGLLNNTLNAFFTNDIMIEVACEPAQSCDTDMKAYKGITARWLASTLQMAPYTSSLILPKMTASAQAAVKQCDANDQCGFKWTTANSDGDTGLGQQMNALAVVQALLVGNAALPATIGTGGVAPGNSSSPSNSSSSSGLSSTLGAGAGSSSTAQAASTSATSKSSLANALALETPKLGMSLVQLAFLACVVL